MHSSTEPTQLPLNVRMVSTLNIDHQAFNMANDREARALSIAEDKHFWHLSRNRFIATRLARLAIKPGARILDLGCGGGCVTAHLARCGYRLAGIDGHPTRIFEAALRAPSAHVWVCDLASGTAEIGEKDFDAVCLFDVIEHLDKPAAVVEQALRFAKPRGLVVGTVPALQRLWGEVGAFASWRLRVWSGAPFSYKRLLIDSRILRNRQHLCYALRASYE